MDPDIVNRGSLFDSLADEKADTLHELFERLVRGEAGEQEEFTDYRRYLDFDIAVTTESGRYYFSQVLKEKSGGIGLSAEFVKDLVIQDIPAKTILLIENLTTYHEVLRVPEILPPPILVIYSGGFPHKSTQKLLQKIAVLLSDRHKFRGSQEDGIIFRDIEIYHWGDMDYGGIRIFEDIKRNFFPTLKPYRMDGATYLEYENVGLAFGEDQARKLQVLLSEPTYADWSPVIGKLLEYRKRVEQESIGVR